MGHCASHSCDLKRSRSGDIRLHLLRWEESRYAFPEILHEHAQNRGGPINIITPPSRRRDQIVAGSGEETISMRAPARGCRNKGNAPVIQFGGRWCKNTSLGPPGLVDLIQELSGVHHPLWWAGCTGREEQQARPVCGDLQCGIQVKELSVGTDDRGGGIELDPDESGLDTVGGGALLDFIAELEMGFTD
ncbi:hypothetical protein BJX61DRAFT_545823 [Aspergillus egyptiacus]|nr:hypothetical protein BJX61DRAFT_545823 [Aspergillus egyptiacus]